jgi:hypothetical protein
MGINENAKKRYIHEPHEKKMDFFFQLKDATNRCLSYETSSKSLKETQSCVQRTCERLQAQRELTGGGGEDTGDRRDRSYPLLLADSTSVKGSLSVTSKPWQQWDPQALAVTF